MGGAPLLVASAVGRQLVSLLASVRMEIVTEWGSLKRWVVRGNSQMSLRFPSSAVPEGRCLIATLEVRPLRAIRQHPFKQQTSIPYLLTVTL